MTKILNNKICIRLSDEAYDSYNYLRVHKLNPAYYLRLSGEKGVILKAKEFKEEKVKIKIPF